MIVIKVCEYPTKFSNNIRSCTLIVATEIQMRLEKGNEDATHVVTVALKKTKK